MDTSDQQGKFEAWARGKFDLDQNIDKTNPWFYHDQDTQYAWQTWQACVQSNAVKEVTDDQILSAYKVNGLDIVRTVRAIIGWIKGRK